MALVGGGLYWGALNNPFHYDDLHSIRHNPHIRSLANIPTFFVDLHTFSSERAGTMFRPLLLCSYALNYALHGEWVGGYRLFNLVLHVSCAFLAWRMVWVWGGKRGMAYVVGGMFLLHPLAAEPVNYISSRSDMLSAFFVLLALQCIPAGAGARSWKVLAPYLCGLLVKSVAIVLPGLALLGLGGDWRRRIHDYWGLFAGMGALALVYIGVIFANRFLSSSLAKAPRTFDVNAWTQVKAWVYALWMAVVPVHLSVDHLFVEARSFGDIAVLCAGGLLLSLFAIGIYNYRRWLGMGLLWWFIALAPYAFIPLNIMVSERRIYLASVGLMLVMGWSLWVFLQRRAVAAGAVLAAVAVFFVVLVSVRNGVWASDISLWEDALREGAIQPRARVNLALAYGRDGRWDDAHAQLEEALRQSPDFADAWVELGNIEHQMGRLDAAQQAYERAIGAQSWLAGAHYNLGNIQLAKGDAVGAVKSYERALELNPNFAMAHNNWAQGKEGLGEVEQALRGYRQALAIDPQQPQAWFNLAHLLEVQGARVESGQSYWKAYELLRAAEDYDENVQYREFAARARAAASRLGVAQ